MALHIRLDDVFRFPDGYFRVRDIDRETETLVFDQLIRKASDARQIKLRERELSLLLGNAKAAKIDFFTNEDGEPQPANENAEYGPDDEDSEAATRDRTFQFYVQKYDELGVTCRGKLGLQLFIAAWRPIARQKGLTHDVKPARLLYAIDNCGVAGNRPIKHFRSRRGKVKRKHFSPFVEGALQEAVDFYWSLRQRTLTDAYAFFREDLINPKNECRIAKGDDPLKFPRRPETLRRRINETTNHINWSRKFSKREADLKFQGIAGSLKATEPLELVILDHTVVDVWNVIDTETFLPLGRPTLTVAIDVATRMILGFLVSFEPPSLYSVLTTLKRVNTNKYYVSKWFRNVDGIWDGWGHPISILVDQAFELTGPSFQDAMQDLGTEVVWAPVRTPQYKAIGERFFRTLNMKLVHRLIGGVPYDPKTMRDVGLDPQKDAIITLQDLESLLHEVIIDVYQGEFHSGLNGIPARVWEEKLKASGRRVIDDIASLNKMLGRVHTGQLTRRGIKFKNMIFHEKDVATRLLNELVRKELKKSQSTRPISSARATVKFKWNPADASSIEVWNHGASPPHYVTLRNISEKYFRGLSFWHFKKIRDYAISKDLKFRSEDEMWKARNELRKRSEKLAGLTPMRESRDARRTLMQMQGTYEDNDEPLSFEEVARHEAEPTPDGRAKARLIPIQAAATDREDWQQPKGKGPSKTSVRRAQATRRARKKEREELDAQNRRKHHERERSGSENSPGTSNVSFNTKDLLARTSWKDI